MGKFNIKKTGLVFSLFLFLVNAAFGLWLTFSPDKKMRARTYSELSTRLNIDSNQYSAGSEQAERLKTASFAYLLEAIVLQPHDPLLWIRLAYFMADEEKNKEDIHTIFEIAAALNPGIKFDIEKQKQYLNRVYRK